MHGEFIDDFKVYVNGEIVPYETEIKIMVDDGEVTDILKVYGITPETFGGYCIEEDHDGSDNILTTANSREGPIGDLRSGYYRLSTVPGRRTALHFVGTARWKQMKRGRLLFI